MSVLINNNGKLDPVAGNGIQNTFTGTSAEVTAAMAAGEIAEGTVVYITDDNGVGVNAGDVTYDNTESGMEATNVQDAIDGIESDLSTKLVTAIVEDHANLYDTAYILKSGNIVTVQLNGVKNVVTGSSSNLFQLDTEYRPNVNINTDLIVNNSGTLELYRMSIATTGWVSIYPYLGTTGAANCRGALTFVNGYSA